MQDVAEERVEEIERCYRVMCSEYGRLLALVARADEEQDGLLLGSAGTAGLLAGRLRVTRAVAAGMVADARGLRRCPATREALEAGVISPGHVRQILAGVKVVAHVPQGVGRAEEILLALAVAQDAGAVKSAVAGIKQVLDPVGVEYEHRARRERSVCYLAPMLDGMWDLAGTLDAESGAVLATALDSLATGYLNTTENAEAGATAGAAVQQHQKQQTLDKRETPQQPVTSANPENSAGPQTPESSDRSGPPNRLTGPQRRALALTDLAARALTAGEVGVHGGTRPHLSVLIPEQSLTTASTSETTSGQSAATSPTAVAKTAYGHPLPPSTARRLACDAHLTPIRIDGQGLPLNVGRTKRLATTAQRKALAVRDGGCTHPGCRIGPQWCDAHHIISWLDGGTTDLDNLVLLCRRHHTDTHYDQQLAALATPFTEFALAC